MTDKEKALEIVGGNWMAFNKEFSAALQMAEYKNQQFISILPEIFDYFENNVGLYDGGLDHSDVDKPAFIEYFSNIITNQYDK